MANNKAVRLLLFTNGLVLVAAAILGPVYALFVEEIGGSLLDASITGAIFSIAAGITTLISGKFTDKIKENELIVVFGYLVVGTGFFLYSFVNSMLFLAIVQVIIGFGEAIYWPAYDAIYTKHIHRKSAGWYWGMWESMAYFTYAGGAIIGGLIINYFGFTPAFLLMSALCCFSALYIYFLPRKTL